MVTLRVAGSSRFCARPPMRQRHVLHLDVGGLQPVEHEEAVPAGGVADS